jgi:hypothetical protein
VNETHVRFDLSVFDQRVMSENNYSTGFPRSWGVGELWMKLMQEL